MGFKKFILPRLGSEHNEDWAQKIKFNPKLLAIIPIIAIPTFIFKSFMIIISLIALTIAVSYFGQKTKLKKFGLELATFTTIITGISFGALPGALIGMILIAIHNILTRRINPYWIIVMPTFGLIGALASLYSGINIFLLGLGLTIFSHFAFIMFQTVLHRFPAKYLPYFALNVLFNAFLFYRFAPLVIGVL